MFILVGTTDMGKRDWLVTLLSKLHLSLAMAIFMLLIAAAIEGDSNRAQGIAVSAWIAEKFYLIGLYVDNNTWKWGMVIMAVMIAFTRPTPTIAFYMAFPLIAYGGLLAWYGVETGRLPLVTLAFMAAAMVAVLVVMVTWPTLIQSVVENVALKKDAEQVSSGNTSANA